MAQNELQPIEAWSSEQPDGSLKLHGAFGEDFSTDRPPEWMLKDQQMDAGFMHLSETLPERGHVIGMWYADDDKRAADLGRRPTAADYENEDEDAELPFEVWAARSHALWYAKDGINRAAEDERLDEAMRGGHEPFPTKDGFLDRIGLAVALARVPHGVVGIDEAEPGVQASGYAMGKLHQMFGVYALARMRYDKDHDVMTAAEIQLDHTAQWIRAGQMGALAGAVLLDPRTSDAPTSMLTLPSRQVDTRRKLEMAGVPEVYDDLRGDVEFDLKTQISTIAMKEGQIPADIR